MIRRFGVFNSRLQEASGAELGDSFLVFDGLSSVTVLVV